MDKQQKHARVSTKLKQLVGFGQWCILLLIGELLSERCRADDLAPNVLIFGLLASRYLMIEGTF